ncbi:MAG: helix-turn-helix transcriptional regulator, partial [Micromonosporaceae bacterium]
ATPATAKADSGTGHKTVTRPDTPDSRVPATGADTASPTVRTPKRSTARTVSRTPVRTSVPDTTVSVTKLRDRYPGITQKDIADRLGISERTVRRHLNSGASNEGGQQ